MFLQKNAPSVATADFLGFCDWSFRENLAKIQYLIVFQMHVQKDAKFFRSDFFG